MLRLATASPMRNNWNCPAGIAHHLLPPPGQQRRVVDLAEIARQRAQRVIQLGRRQRAVLDHHLIDNALEPFRSVIGADRRAQAHCPRAAPTADRALIVMRTPWRWNAAAYSVWFMPPISGAKYRSGETISTALPASASSSAVCIA